ncbi:MAG: hypothetical protein MZU97_01415 [Bacillus subtilis]|nr:hypothetical protein [Bacillus subtilis]
MHRSRRSPKRDIVQEGRNLSITVTTQEKTTISMQWRNNHAQDEVPFRDQETSQTHRRPV